MVQHGGVNTGNTNRKDFTYSVNNRGPEAERRGRREYVLVTRMHALPPGLAEMIGFAGGFAAKTPAVIVFSSIQSIRFESGCARFELSKILSARIAKQPGKSTHFRTSSSVTLFPANGSF